ncbi:MAG: ABC transporter substrate-binding protein [Desulfovibrio sp.]|nr:ABC transporter substrate-binding protein [Desulfovibrio sp.]
MPCFRLLPSVLSRCLACCLALLLAAAPVCAQDDAASMPSLLAMTPQKKPDGTRFRIGYFEGGPYAHYPATLKATVQGLVDLGWCQPLDFPPVTDPEDARAVWAFLATNARSEYIEFVADAFFGGDWNEKTPRETIKQQVLGRLTQKKDIDLMFAMGTWAGQDLANNAHTTPTLVMSASDPIGAKIIPSVDDSGLDHLNARVDPTRYQRQVRLFHDIIGFKKLGVVYENTVAGRSYAALDDVTLVAQERGIELVTCTAELEAVNTGQASRNLRDCHERLAAAVDAVYLTENAGMQLHRLPMVLEPLNKARIPTFSQAGSEEVRHGVLLSIAQAGFRYVGEFHARTIAQVLRGATPRSLPQRFEEPPKIAINLKVAEVVGFDPPVDILMAADEIYEEIVVAPAPASAN